MEKGEKWKCGVCGLVVTVEEPCECEGEDLMCCGVPMKDITAGETPAVTIQQEICLDCGI